MEGFRRQFKTGATAIAAVGVMALGLQACDSGAPAGTGGGMAPAAMTGTGAGAGDFQPDAVFQGSSLTGWEVVGQADWQAENGELVGNAQAGSGWLISDQALQNLLFFANVSCEGDCETGVLLRAEGTPDGGMRGIYASLSGDFATYRVTLDADGNETSREPLVVPGEGRGGRGGGRGGAPPSLTSGWNPLMVTIWDNEIDRSLGAGGPLTDPATPSYGAIGLYAGGSGQVRFKDVSWKDINRVVEEPERVSDRFTMHHISRMYYGWSAKASDVNQDGAMDIVSGPFYYLGPSYSERRIFRQDRIYNPATEYAPDMVNFTHDFTGDGWPDILSSELSGGRPLDLYVNPQGESHLWEMHQVLPTVSTEIVLMRDLDDDGTVEMIFGGGGLYSWARPDPANPTAVWTSHPISTEEQSVSGHGLGVGDVNGDGRKDVVTPNGWYEQPAGGIETSPWAYHAATYGNLSIFGMGGGEMGVYDMNGDGLTDIVAGSAHNWGLNWFEQQQDGTFVQHVIAGDFSTPENAGGVTFSESHAARVGDMDGDGILDFIVGKRYWSHLENYGGPDPYGPAVIYIYRTVRNPEAPGGAEFVPELVHNKSGVGSAFEVMDINGDGMLDIATANAYGTHVFLTN